MAEDERTGVKFGQSGRSLPPEPPPLEDLLNATRAEASGLIDTPPPEPKPAAPSSPDEIRHLGSDLARLIHREHGMGLADVA